MRIYDYWAEHRGHMPKPMGDDFAAFRALCIHAPKNPDKPYLDGLVDKAAAPQNVPADEKPQETKPADKPAETKSKPRKAGG